MSHRMSDVGGSSGGEEDDESDSQSEDLFLSEGQ
eukprot:SAG11_NODE_12575_length_696_cov_1.693467_1_plen_33_part_01